MDENADGGVVTSVATENATSVTVSDERFEVADGNLKLAAGTTLDFETDDSPIEVTITASGDGDSATHTVRVSINDVNEGPSISVADGTTPDGMAAASTINENAAGVPVGEITLSDPDAGDTHTLAVSDDRFETSQDSAGGWWLKLKDGESLDHEAGDTVTVTVTVTDAGGLSASTDVTVTVSNVDEAPSAPQVRGDLFDVDENAGGVAITSLSDSTDPEGDAVTYAVSDDRFEITAGLVLRVKDGASLDHEEAGSVDIMLTAMDAAGNVSEATVVTITVNDVNEAPTVMAADHAVDENEAGVALGAITASDPDGDTLTVEVSGGGDRFEARQDAEGGWWVALKDGESLDHETEESVTVMVTVTDAAGLSATTEATVTVNDVNETFMLEAADGAVDENAEGAVVGAVAATGDPDDGDTHTFMVEDDDRFEVKDGMLKLMDDESLNHETEETVTVMVTATDSGGNTQQASVTVTVNDVNEDPTFARSEYAFNLSENAAGPVGVGMVSGDDVDDGDTLMYSITGGNDDGLFAIDSASGAISYVGTGEDYRSSVTGPSHTLTVQVSDGDGASADATVGITILNANDAPMFGASNYAFDLAENDDGSTTAVDVGMVSASDSDEGDAVTYSITGGNDDGLFAIDAATGAITYVGSGEDAETTASHALTVSASDGSASSEAMVTVTVTNANDSTPAFGEDSYAFDLAENANGSATAVAVGMVSATDSDGDTLSYSITAGNDDNLFAIDAASGAITYEGAGENYESGATSHELTVSASDGTNSDSATVTVTVTDVNDAPMADADMMIDTLALVSGTAGSMEVDLGALFTDQDGDSLTFSIDAGEQNWLSLSVTRSDDGSITGNISGTAPDNEDLDPAMVKIVATDPGGATGEATFYVVVDAVNAAPSSLTVKHTDDGGVTTVVTAKTITENDAGVSFGMVTVEDVDNAMHPHGQHEYSFMLGDDAADDLFEVTDEGILRLKEGKSLDYEKTGDTIVLTVTATDKYVTAPGDGEEDTRGSISLPITITVENVVLEEDAGPGANEIGDWWVTVDEDLDAEDVLAGDWLNFSLQTGGDDKPAFDDGGKGPLTFALADGAPEWLQIDSKSGAMTNKPGVMPDSGAYTITVIATDTDGNTGMGSFTLAVAVAEPDHSDNNDPNIISVSEGSYTEGTSDSVRVATFAVRDEDLPIAPHPYGTLKVEIYTAIQEDGRNVEDGRDVKDLFKLVEVEGDPDGDPETTQYEIWTKSAAELAVDDKGKELKTPLMPLDYEDGDEVEITVKVVDAPRTARIVGEEDKQGISIEIIDTADEAPVFDHANHKFDSKTMMGTTTFTVDQQEDDDDKEVIVLQLTDVWSDLDTDVDLLRFSVDGDDNLPSWIEVYGPNRWEAIYTRVGDIVEADSDARDRDMVVAIVIDRTAASGDNESAGKGLASFTLTATDGTNPTTETISFDVNDKNVDITADEDNPVVSFAEGDDPNGIGSLNMVFDAAQDPDLSSADDATLVVYTWSSIAVGTDGEFGTDDDEETVISVSSTPQPLMLDGGLVTGTTANDRTNDFEGLKIKASVQYYEVNPETKAIDESMVYMAVTDTVEQESSPTATRVSFEVTTDASGLLVDITATGDAQSATGNVRLQSSTDGSDDSWINVATGNADTSATNGLAANVDLDVDANGDGTTTSGDGGGLHYRVVYSYTVNGQTKTVNYDVGQLGTLSTVTAADVTDILGADAGTDLDAGGSIRVNTQGNNADVQWQVRDNAVSPWMDIDGANAVALDVTGAYADKDLRAKVTYMTQKDDPDTTVDESKIPTEVDYTEIIDVAGRDNVVPVTSQATHEVRVSLGAAGKAGQPTKIQMDSVADLFFDSDGDPLKYSISASPTVTVDAGAADATATPPVLATPGAQSEALPGGGIWLVHETEDVAGTDTNTGEVRQSLAINRDTGKLTYITDLEQGHDGTTTDGTGNVLTFTIAATDNGENTTTPPTATVTVRINVAPTEIELTDGGGTAVDLPAGTVADPAYALQDSNGAVTFAENVENQAEVNLGTIDVMDQNLAGDGTNAGDPFGIHKVTVSDDRFEAREEATPDGDGSTWVLWLKEDATFDYETDGDKKGTLEVTVTATDGGGLSKSGKFKITITDVEDDPETPPPPPPPPPPTVPGLKDDGNLDDDGPVVPPPGDGGMFIDDLIDLHVGDDLLGDYVLAIDDIDVA